MMMLAWILVRSQEQKMMLMTGSNTSPNITTNIKIVSSITGSDLIPSLVLKDNLLGNLNLIDHLPRKEILTKIIQINHDQAYRKDC